MTNYEKYKREIEKFARLNVKFALDKETRNIVCCAGLQCPQCEFHEKNKIGHICEGVKLTWADAEYIEPEEKEVDWSKVAVDTPILVRNSMQSCWFERHFAKYEDNLVYAWDAGKTSYTGDSITFWGYAKLANENETRCNDVRNL